MANCIKMSQKTRKNQWCAQLFPALGRQLQHAAVENPLNLAIFWVWRISGIPTFVFLFKKYTCFFFNTHVWWKKFSVSFLPSKNHDAFLLTLAVCCLPFSDTHLLAATGSYLAATWPQGGSVLKAPLIQWGSETRWRQIVRLGSTKSIA